MHAAASSIELYGLGGLEILILLSLGVLVIVVALMFFALSIGTTHIAAATIAIGVLFMSIFLLRKSSVFRRGA